MSNGPIDQIVDNCGQVSASRDGALDLDNVGGAGDGVAQPVGPLEADEFVARAPDDEGRYPQAGEGWFDREQVTGAQGRQQPLELASRFRVGERGFQLGPHDFLG